MNLKFKTISSVILSPRGENTLYMGIDFARIEKNGNIGIESSGDKFKMIYPFYSYEDRNFNSNYSFEFSEKYYIPASSLKGALLSNQSVNLHLEGIDGNIRRKILVKDIELKKTQIELNNIFKFQYLYQEKQEQQEIKESEYKYKIPKLEEFFPALALEMLKSEESFEANILLKISEDEFRDILKETFDTTKQKLERYMKEIGSRIAELKSWQKNRKVQDQNTLDEPIEQLQKIKEAIKRQVSSGKNMIFLGGYKGILGSILVKSDVEIRNGFYIDVKTNLPYGLVEICQ